jgi:hypothetical protein
MILTKHVEQLGNGPAHTALVAILALTGLVHVTSISCGHGWAGGDFAWYIMQAQSIVDGTTHSVAAMGVDRFENSSRIYMDGPANYPWGFPILLSPLIAIFGTNLLPLKWLIVALLLISQVFLYLLLKGRICSVSALLIALLFGINPFIVQFKNNIVSDVPFAMLCFLSLYLVHKIILTRKRLLGRGADEAIVGLSIMAAVITRIHGFALLAPLLISLAMARRVSPKPSQKSRTFGRKFVIAAIPYAAFCLGVLAISLVLPSAQAGYIKAHLPFLLRDPGEVALTIAYNLVFYAALPARFFDIPVLEHLINLIALPLAVLGSLKRLKIDLVLLTFVAVYTSIFLFFPFYQGARFILPIFPFYLYFSAVGAQEVVLRLRGSSANTPVLYLLLISAVTIGTTSEAWANVPRDCKVAEGPYSAESQDMFSYVRSQTLHSDTIVFFKPRVLMLYTGRRSIIHVRLDKILSSGGDFVLLYSSPAFDRGVNARLRKTLTTSPNCFQLAYGNQKFQLYRITPLCALKSVD